MSKEMTFYDLCKLIKSTDEFNIEFNTDISGCLFYHGGFIINYNVNNKPLKMEWDMFPLFEEEGTWEDAKEIFRSFIDSDFDTEFYQCQEKDIELDDETCKIAKEKMIRCINIIINQIEAIAEQEKINLDNFFKYEEEDDD